MPTCPNCGEGNPEQARFCMACAGPLAAPEARELRKTVTIVFSDLVGSTALGEALDSEALRELLNRYFDAMRSCLERHGGVVEKYIGDAVMAVFGLPRAHEDDALRALRAALDMQRTLAELNHELGARWGAELANRTGVYTGEVVTGDAASGQRLVTGDAVNTAARLEQAAPAGHVLLGEPTYRLTQHAVRVEKVGPVDAKGKSWPLVAYRLLSTGPPDGTEGSTTRLVGREVELQSLIDAFDRVRRERRCTLVTVVGEAGFGKTRLVAEFLGQIQGPARIAQGRCLSYGEGITYWALSEAVRKTAAIGEDESRDAALAKLRDVCRGAVEADMICARVATGIGLASDPFPREEVAWGFRKLLEHLAQEDLFVLVLDDIQWAEPSLLEAIVHIASFSRSAPLLVLCMSRPRPDDQSSAWADGTPNPLNIHLEALPAGDGEALVETFLGGVDVPKEIMARVLGAANGNPLFIEQMLSMWRDEGTISIGARGWELAADPGELRIPPSIQALLAARLDALIEHERAVLERGAIVGQTFYRGAVETMAPDTLRPMVAPGLASLTIKRMIRTDDSPFEEDEAFAFVHLLVRDAAYAGMLKRTRSELHERFADWLLNMAGDRLPEYEEILGYHLEQAYRNRIELGPADDHASDLRTRAATHLFTSARRAFAANDLWAAVTLFDRAISLMPEDDLAGIAALPDLGYALIQVGDFARARSVLDRSVDVASSKGDRRSEAFARLSLVLLALKIDQAVVAEQLRSIVADAIEVFLRSDDDLGLARAFHARGEVAWWAGRFADAEDAFRTAIEHAERGGYQRDVSDNLTWVAMAAYLGPMPRDEALRECEAILQRSRGDLLIQLLAGEARAGLLAMSGRFDEARAIIGRNKGAWRDLGWTVEEAAASQLHADVELVAGDPGAAERELRFGCDVLDRMGEKGYLSTTAGMLANVLAGRGNLDEAERYIAIAVETGAADDARTQVEWRTAMARVSIARGDVPRAIELTAEAVELAEGTDQPYLRGGALVHSAHALRSGGRTLDAIQRAQRAWAEFDAKGDVISARRARDLIEELKAGRSS